MAPFVIFNNLIDQKLNKSVASNSADPDCNQLNTPHPTLQVVTKNMEGPF